jgi:hypothetical protein
MRLAHGNKNHEKSNRFKQKSNPFDEFVVNVEGVKNLDEVNIIMRGSSFDSIADSVDYSLPTFYVNFYEDSEVKSKNPIFVTSDRRIYNILQENQKSPIIFLSTVESMSGNQPCKGQHEIYNGSKLSVYFKPAFSSLELGSGIASIATIKSISNSVNVYGWDSYLEKDIKDMNFIQYFFYLFHVPSNPQYKRSKLMVEKILNFIYASRFIDCKGITIKSYFSNIKFKDNLYKKLRTVLYM